MHGDLIASGILRGKTRAEVVELLGDDGVGDPHLLGYGMASDFFFHGDWGENLFIKFDKDTGRFSGMWTED
jgi:hypothetical protein